ncbi:hypothetical protein BVG81_007425 [Haliangium sp. UPWRP_2]|nr:hypothetical protein BVG81_007425 [Haliangium sp. UPWRP_2]
MLLGPVRAARGQATALIGTLPWKPITHASSSIASLSAACPQPIHTFPPPTNRMPWNLNRLNINSEGKGQGNRPQLVGDGRGQSRGSQPS